MKQGLAIGALLMISVAHSRAQETVSFAIATEPQAMTAARAATVVETRITTGRPYSAEATTEFVQTLGDGNKIARKATVRIFRDGEGRTRREELAADGTVKLVSIYDPVTHITYVLDPATRTARKSAVRVMLPTRTTTGGDGRKIDFKAATELTAADMAGGRVALVAPAELPAVAEDTLKRQIEIAVSADGARGRAVQPVRRVLAEPKNEESLGQKMIDGVLADGKRVTTVLPAGSIGNQQPITVLSEQWFAPDLEILVMTRHSDPRTGETTYSLSNVARGEPAATLFDVPADYTIQDSSYIRTPASR
jgi:hypothetical protein